VVQKDVAQKLVVPKVVVPKDVAPKVADLSLLMQEREVRKLVLPKPLPLNEIARLSVYFDSRRIEQM
jgi:hypothetical protein